MDVSIATIFRPSYVIDLLLFYIHRTSRIVFKNIQFMLFFFFSRLPQTIGSEIIHYLPNFNSIILVSLSLYCSFSFSFFLLFFLLFLLSLHLSQTHTHTHTSFSFILSHWASLLVVVLRQFPIYLNYSQCSCSCNMIILVIVKSKINIIKTTIEV